MKNNCQIKNISDGWKFMQLEEIAKTSSGGTPKSDNFSYYSNGNVPWLTSGEVRKGKISTFENYITKEGLKNSSAKLFPVNTVLVAMYGVTAGQVGILEKESSTNQAICGILPNEKYLPLFLYYFFVRKTGQLLRMGSGAAQPNISQEILRSFDVLLPPLLEQNRIVAVLKTWDGYLEKLSRKIEIKNNIKKGLIQRLLSGKVRLAGFSEEWKNVKLEDVAEIKKGMQLNKIKLYNKGKYPSYSGGITPSGFTDKWNTEQNKIIISEGGNSCGYVNFINQKFWAGGHCYVVVGKEVNKIFLYQYLKFSQVLLMRLRVGSGLPNVQKKDIENFKIDLPLLEEQIAIARILTTADQEIETLEKKKKIIEDQKKFLLNNLITGKIRVPEFIN